MVQLLSPNYCYWVSCYCTHLSPCADSFILSFNLIIAHDVECVVYKVQLHNVNNIDYNIII